MAASARRLVPMLVVLVGLLSLAAVVWSGRRHAARGEGPASVRAAVEVWCRRDGGDVQLDSNASVRAGDRLSFVWRGAAPREVMIFAGSPTKGARLFPPEARSRKIAPGARMEAGADVTAEPGPEVVYVLSADAPFSADDAARGTPGLEPMRLLFLRQPR